MEKIGYFINGQCVEGMFGCYVDVFNLVIGEVQVQVVLVSQDEMDMVIVNVVVV